MSHHSSYNLLIYLNWNSVEKLLSHLERWWEELSRPPSHKMSICPPVNAIIMLMVPNDRLLEKLKLMNLIIWRKSHHSRFQILENLKISLLSHFRDCLNWKLSSHCTFNLWKFRENTISLADLKLWRRENVWKVTSADSTVILRSYLGHTFIINHEYFHKAY